MELYVIRHAIAEPLGKRNEFRDEQRALTEEGRSRMHEIARGLGKLGVELDLILTSPLMRAVETAEIVAPCLGLSRKDVKPTSHLAPGASFEQLFAEIKAQTGVESLALVGHQPDLGMLVSRIILGEGGTASLQLKKGSVCCINVTETVPALRGGLLWLLMPKQLRVLAKK